MLPGPVFLVEMLTTARRKMFYVLRASFGILLLAFGFLPLIFGNRLPLPAVLHLQVGQTCRTKQDKSSRCRQGGQGTDAQTGLR